MKTHYDHIILSPHYDDAALSCSGILLESKSVLVINVFTEFNKHTEKMGFVSGEQRKREEHLAQKRLNYDALDLGFLDVSARKEGLPPAVYFYPLNQDDRDLLAALVEKLSHKLKGISFSHIYLPLGVGWHVDHQLCREAALALKISKQKILFYEDYPYALVPGMTEALFGERNISFFAIYKMLGKTRVIKKFPPLIRFFVRFSVAIFLYQLKGRHYPLENIQQKSIYRENLEEKIDLCYCYETQMDEFFDNRCVMKAFFEQREYYERLYAYSHD